MGLRQDVYLHPGQLEAYASKATNKTLVCGRGWGKTSYVAAESYLCVAAMPKSAGFIAGVTYDQVFNSSLPPIKALWARMGLRENVHYVVGKRPPAHFDTPWYEPEKYGNVISWINGSVIHIKSLDRPNLSRGGNYQWGIVDEAALVKQEVLTKVLLASIRGLRDKYQHSECYLRKILITSMPWKTDGQYIVDDYSELAKAYPDKYYYKEGTAHENLTVLGQDYFDGLEREMPYLEFQVEVLNRRIRAAQTPFYHELDDHRHLYTPSFKYDEGTGAVIGGRNDVLTDELLELSFDFGGWINCATCYQQKGLYEYMRSQHYVKERGIAELVEEFCCYYSKHKCKWVRVWGDPRGHDREAKGSTDFEDVQAEFEKRGWRCTIKAPKGKRTRKHTVRYEYMNKVLRESEPRLPRLRIREDKCADVMISMKLVEKKPDGSKDKRKEKDKNFDQAHAPHLSDTVDYYITQKHEGKAKGRGRRGPKTVETR